MRFELFAQIVGDMAFTTPLSETATRGLGEADSDGNFNGGVIDQVSVTAGQLKTESSLPVIWPSDFDDPHPEDDDEDKTPPNKGGGGTSNTSSRSNDDGDDDNDTPYITTDTTIIQMLKVLKEDCFVGRLFDSITHPITITIDPTIETLGVLDYSNPDAYGVKFKNTSSPLLMSALIEEAVHAYQREHDPDFNSAKLNYELEAKLAWVIYYFKQRKQRISKAYFGEEHYDRLVALATDNMRTPDNDNYTFFLQLLRDRFPNSYADYPESPLKRVFTNLEVLDVKCNN